MYNLNHKQALENKVRIRTAWVARGLDAHLYGDKIEFLLLPAPLAGDEELWMLHELEVRKLLDLVPLPDWARSHANADLYDDNGDSEDDANAQAYENELYQRWYNECLNRETAPEPPEPTWPTRKGLPGDNTKQRRMDLLENFRNAQH